MMMILTKMMLIMIFDADADESIEINHQNWRIGVNLDGYTAFFLFADKKLQ